MSKHASGRGRMRGRPRKKKHSRHHRSPAAKKFRKTVADLVRQQPATADEINRLGKYAVEEARDANAKKLQKRLIDSSDGTVYYKLPSGQMVRSTLRAKQQADGTLIPLPPDPRPSKRERAKEKRRLKRKTARER